MPGMLPEKDQFPVQDYDFLYDDVNDLWISGRSSIIRWVDGSLVYFQSLNDETEKKKTQEQLSEAVSTAEAASTAKSAFLANMSHELRTPLNVVVGLSELQLEDKNLSDEIRANLNKISHAGNTLLSIVNDILDISKIESGKFELTPVEYHLASLLNDTATLAKSRIGEKPITFHLDVSDDLPGKLYGDDLRVKQILVNLLSNAIKYTQQGTVELTVRCTHEDDSNVWMDIIVKDTGIGIRDEDMIELFADFKQVDSLANRKIEGTGLGLAITRKLVTSMDGDIIVESEYGKGSTFHAKIRQGFVDDTLIGPRVAENLRQSRYKENKRHFASSLVRMDLSYAKVLIVDDMQANLDVAAGLMRKYNMQVDCVTSGQEAIDRIKSEKPVYNAVFMDHMMPEMDGVETVDRIRVLGTDYATTIPIIALTANAVLGTEEMFYEHDFQAFISKPIDIMQLDSVIQKFVRDKSREGQTNDSLESPDDSGTFIPELSQGDGKWGIEIAGIDTEKGLAICGGDSEIYRSVMRSCAADVFAVLEKFRYVSAETLPAYTIAIHGLKGASANIGAEALRQTAADLEVMGKNGDLQGVLALNNAFVEEAECLVVEIKTWLEKQEAEVTKPQLHSPDRAILTHLRQCCEDYDFDSANQDLLELEKAIYEMDMELVTCLREKIDTYNFDEAAELLEKYQ
jgi:signal transduction histidine kinase/FixJ family two-component response regulator/HPt (histidine-containing phosphotransfer) domain-containing protein